MSMKSWFVRNIRRASGTDQVLRAFHAASCDVRSDLHRYIGKSHAVTSEALPVQAAPAQRTECANCTGLEVLSGTPYQKVLLPLDYRPSREYRVAIYLLEARHRVRVLMPSAYLTKTACRKDSVEFPIVDLGQGNEGWRHGGSLWFTHAALRGSTAESRIPIHGVSFPWKS